MNKKCLFAVVIVLVSLICLSACGALRDTADKNKALNESLPYYELNAANYDEISYNGLTYTITDECLEMSELQEEIGQVSKRFKNVAGEDFSFGYVYSIVDVNISNAVAALGSRGLPDCTEQQLRDAHLNQRRQALGKHIKGNGADRKDRRRRADQKKEPCGPFFPIPGRILFQTHSAVTGAGSGPER